MDNNAHVNPIQVQKFLSGVDYPVDKQTIISKAQQEGADDNIINTLSQIPDQEFQTPAEVSQAIGKIE